MASLGRPNWVTELLKQGKVAFGLRSFTTHPGIIEIMGWTGFDFVSIDTEHTPADIGATLSAVRACELTGITPIIRVYENSPPLICKALDNGAQGVIVPHISTVAQAEAAVRFAKFPPLGERSACPLTRAAQFGILADKEYYQKVNEDTLVILLIEGAEGLKNTPDILKIKGVDAISFGPGDYSQSIGIPGETYEHPKIYGALKEMVKMCDDAGVPVMTVMYKLPSSKMSDVDYAKKIIDAGVKLVHLGSDVSIFRQSCEELLKIKALA